MCINLSIHVLARQGLAFRGDGNESNSNLMALLDLRSEDDTKLVAWAKQRTDMTQQRLNHLMLLHIHKCHTNNLDLIDVANDFIDGNEHRKNFFGSEFKQTDRD